MRPLHPIAESDGSKSGQVSNAWMSAMAATHLWHATHSPTLGKKKKTHFFLFPA
jgi:hypothetical protein